MRDAFQRGIDLFNKQEFYDCHEVLEEVWTPLRGPRRLFLQALIHLAVGFYHYQQGNPAGTERQLQKGLKKLAAYLPGYEGIETAQLYRDAIDCLERVRRRQPLARFPVISKQKQGCG
jgi:predicted metal-dependent hydrolase